MATRSARGLPAPSILRNAPETKAHLRMGREIVESRLQRLRDQTVVAVEEDEEFPAASPQACVTRGA